MVLSDQFAAGTPLTDVLPVGDDILEIETLYNRPDLTSIYGIAREVAVLTGGRAVHAVEGKDVFSVQYHPEASPGPMDSHYLFERFADAAKKRT